MKLLTLNFLTCARKACKTSAAAFPLHPRDAELEVVETELNLPFISNILPRLDWEAMRTLAAELGLPTLPETAPEPAALFSSPTADEADAQEPNQLARDLHGLLVETTIQQGSLVCANCEHQYAVKEGIANFLLPSHLV
ncbi:uncharacterized protein J3D65DRAFT_664880 [Phyllosticta citribraziliensis]|uniref:Trm112p-domain-containing protein n=1 Tax=Phyllosticta citribraziliensis TaxID=989973 RepID=A0ABR1M4K2_9PEZI